MHCSGTMEDVQLSPNDVFLKKYNVKNDGGLLFVPPIMHGKLEQLHFCLCKKRPRKRNEQFGCGMQFCCWALQQFFTRGELVAVSHANPKSNLAIAQEQSAKVRLCETARAKHGSAFL